MSRFVERFVAIFAIITLIVAMVPQQVRTESVNGIFGMTKSTLHMPIFSPDPKFPESKNREPRYEKQVIATAYSSDPYQTDSTPCTPAMGSFDLCENYTATGLENSIAANFLPLGAHVRFPEMYGEKIFVVRDRMNARYNGTSRIDFWVGSDTPTSSEIIKEAKSEAIEFGVKRLVMEVF